ncbi:MAG: hypothetical protein ACE5LQ_06790 [Candidatus Bipolaricaulia bacterium]
MKGSKRFSRTLLVLVPLGVLAAFFALFRAATVSYLGSSQAWYIVLSVILALIALQLGSLALRRVAERTESPILRGLLKMKRRRE